MNQEILSLKNVTKNFPGVRALDEASIRVYAGKVMGLVGENGAGKSTILKILSGIHQPTKGEYLIEGQRVTINGVSEATRHGISIVHQELEMMEELTVLENLFIGKELRTKYGSYAWSKMEKKTNQVLLEIGASFLARDIVHTLSIGNQQMVEIAKSYLNNSKVICLDEPTSSLTTKEINALFKLIRKLKTQGVSFIYVSHRMNEIPLICDDITVFRDGKFIIEKSIADFNEDEIINYIIGRQLDKQYPRIQVHNSQTKLVVKNWYAPGVIDVSFEARSGEILGFFGLMGAGRTELFKSIIGFNKKTNGRLKIDGIEKNYNHPRAAIDDKVFYLSEDRKLEVLILNFSHARNISLSSLSQFIFGKLPIINFKKENQYGTRAIIDNGIKASSYDEKTIALSGGNQQKVAIAKALAAKPDIIIFDEPTRGIDVGAKNQIYEMMNHLKAAGKCIILISSEIQEVMGMADQMYIMADGRILDKLTYPHFDKEKIIHKIVTTSVNS